MLIRINNQTPILYGLLLLELICIFLPQELFMTLQYVELLFICMYCFFRGLSEKSFVNPFILFVITPISLLIYNYNVNPRYLLCLENKIYILAIVNMLAFLIVLNHGVRPKYNYYPIADNSKYYSKYARLGIMFIVLSFVPDVFALVFSASMPLGAFFSMLLYLGIAFAVKSEQKGTKKIAYILIIIKLLLSFNKTVILMSVLTIIIALTTKRNNNNKKLKFIIPLVIIFSYLFIIYAFPLKTYFRTYGSFSGLSSIDELRSITDNSYENYSDEWKFDSSLFMPYMSLVTPWTNLNYVINTQPGYSYGLWIIKPVLGFLQVDTSGIEAYTLRPMNGSFNTYGFLTVQVKDFGLYCAVLITILLGIFVSYSYNKYVRQQWNPIAIAEYSLVACAVFEMFYSNHFFAQGYTQAVYIVSFVLIICLRSFDKGLYWHLKGLDTGNLKSR